MADAVRCRDAGRSRNAGRCAASSISHEVSVEELPLRGCFLDFNHLVGRDGDLY